MIKPFARVDFSERDNYLRYLANTDMYKDKIVFVLGNDLDIPNEIYVGPTKYADASGTFEGFDASDAWGDIFVPPTTIAPPVQ